MFLDHIISHVDFQSLKNVELKSLLLVARDHKRFGSHYPHAHEILFLKSHYSGAYIGYQSGRHLISLSWWPVGDSVAFDKVMNWVKA